MTANPEPPLNEQLAARVDALTYEWGMPLEPWQRDMLERKFAEDLGSGEDGTDQHPMPVAWCAVCGRPLFPGDGLCPPGCGEDRDPSSCAAPGCQGDHVAEVTLDVSAQADRS